MANFCINCGAKIRKEDKFCINCGTKIRKEENFCINCGTKIRKEDKFCMNCGAKINKSDIGQNNHALKSAQDNIEKRKFKIVKEEEKEKKLKIIDEIFESEEIKSEIKENNIDPAYVIFIKEIIKNDLINKKGDMTEGEIKYYIKTELKKAIKEQRKLRLIKEKEERSKKEEMRNKEKEKNEIINGGYCSFSCRHCYEEFLDSMGGIVGDFDSGGSYEYYCNLGHRVHLGSFCEDYE